MSRAQKDEEEVILLVKDGDNSFTKKLIAYASDHYRTSMLENDDFGQLLGEVEEKTDKGQLLNEIEKWYSDWKPIKLKIYATKLLARVYNSIKPEEKEKYQKEKMLAMAKPFVSLLVQNMKNDDYSGYERIAPEIKAEHKGISQQGIYELGMLIEELAFKVMKGEDPFAKPKKAVPKPVPKPKVVEKKKKVEQVKKEEEEGEDEGEAEEEIPKPKKVVKKEVKKPKKVEPEPEPEVEDEEDEEKPEEEIKVAKQDDEDRDFAITAALKKNYQERLRLNARLRELDLLDAELYKGKLPGIVVDYVSQFMKLKMVYIDSDIVETPFKSVYAQFERYMTINHRKVKIMTQTNFKQNLENMDLTVKASTRNCRGRGPIQVLRHYEFRDQELNK